VTLLALKREAIPPVRAFTEESFAFIIVSRFSVGLTSTPEHITTIEWQVQPYITRQPTSAVQIPMLGLMIKV
jgi:hypothetical protein